MRVRLLAISLLAASAGLVGCGGGGGGSGGGAGTGAETTGSESAATTPGAGAEAGTTEQALPEPTNVRYVSPSGSDSGDGSQAAPWQTLEHAVASATPGTRLVLQGGSWDGLVIEGVDGTADAPIVITGAEGERPVFHGAIDVKAAYWVLDGIEVASTEPRFSVRFTGAGAHDSTIRNSVIHGGTGAAGVSIDTNAANIKVEGNEIYEISRGETDAHGIVVQPTTKKTSIVGNDIHDTSGDSIQCIGPGQDAMEGAPANGLVIEGNTLYDTRENAVDIKHCQNVEIRGNTAHGFHKSSTSNGEAMVIHLQANTVTVEGNDISGSSRGVVTGRGAQKVTVRRNVIHDMVDERTGVILGEGAGFAVQHNTIVGVDTGVQALAGSGKPAVENNIFSECAESVSGDAAVQNNLFDGSPVVGEPAVQGDPALDGEFRPGESSAAIDSAAASSDGTDACGAGPDMGAVERC